MAKAKGKNQTKEKSHLPAGFDKLSSDRGAPWVIFSDDIDIHGYLLGRFSMPDKKKGGLRWYYQLKLIDGGVACSKQKEEIEADAGDIVNVNETGALKVYQPLCENGGKYEIFFHVNTKIDIDGGQTYWDIEPGSKTLKAPSKKTGGDTGDDDIPF